jgi:putative transcriptional regulator
MTITHHLDDATLMSFAAGSLKQALSVVAASHVTGCAQCAQELRRMEAVGAALFAGLTPARMAKSAPVLQLARAEDGSLDVPGADIETKGDMPAPLARLLGPYVDNIAWHRLGPGVWHYKIALPGEGESGGDLRLLKISAGRRMPDHGHRGSELTLILDGAYSDKTGTYRTGDVADLGDDLEHRPIADAEHGCICVVASEQPARYKGMIQKLIQPLTGM